LNDFESPLGLSNPSRILRPNDYLEGMVKVTTDKIMAAYSKPFSNLVAKDIATA